MTDFNLFEWMIAEKIATNAFNASAILNGVKAFQVESTEEKKARVLLYRKWRTKTDKKNQLPTWQAFELAIAGIDPDDVPARQIELFDDEEDDDYGVEFSNDRLNAAHLASERAAVLALLPATKKQIVKKTGFSAWRVAIALRGMWVLTGGIYEHPTDTAKLD